MIRRLKIRTHERGLLFREGELEAVLRPGVHWYLDPLLKLRLEVVTPRDPWLVHKDLDIIVKSGKLGSDAVVIDLKDHGPRSSRCVRPSARRISTRCWSARTRSQASSPR